jgi:polyphosphate kinase
MPPAPADRSLAVAAPTFTLLDRDHSILSFNERVLDWAHRREVPLIERLRYLCIVSSNLDEFFEVRAAPHLIAGSAGDHKGTYTVESFERLAEAAHKLVAKQYALYNDELMPTFATHGIHIISHGERNAAQRKWVSEYFEREVRPLLIPVGLDPAHPFPQVANKSLNFIVRLGGKDAFGRENPIQIVKVPRVLPRLIRMPAKVSDGKTLFVALSSVVRAHLASMFVGREVGDFSQFRVTRHSDLAVDEEDVKNLRTALRQGLQHRHYGQAVRLEVSASCAESLASFLLAQFNLPPQALYRVHGPVNLARLTQLADLLDEPQLRFAPYPASFPVTLSPSQSFFERLQRGDVLIHQPFESFDGVLAFLREAVLDPQVLAIKQTIYRTGADSELMDLLREAVRRGKEVTVVVELKARFDEEANINWAEMLESIGAQVVYGVVGLKTHAKMLLVTRREGKQMRRYGHLSTGNYNPRTARLYTDISHLTADPLLTADMEAVFVHLGQPEPAAQAQPHVARALRPAQEHRGADRFAGRGRRGRPADAHRRQDERADRRGNHRRADSRGAAGREDRPDRARCLHAAGAGAGADRQHPRAFGDRALPGAFAGVLFPQRRRRIAVPVERRLDEPQHDAAHRARLARDRPGPAPAADRRMPGGVPARRARRLGPGRRRHLHARRPRHASGRGGRFAHHRSPRRAGRAHEPLRIQRASARCIQQLTIERR